MGCQTLCLSFVPCLNYIVSSLNLVILRTPSCDHLFDGRGEVHLTRTDSRRGTLIVGRDEGALRLRRDTPWWSTNGRLRGRRIREKE